MACVSSNLGSSSSLHIPAASLNSSQQEQEMQGLRDEDCYLPSPMTCWMRWDISLPSSLLQVFYFRAVQTPNLLHGTVFVKGDGQSAKFHVHPPLTLQANPIQPSAHPMWAQKHSCCVSKDLQNRRRPSRARCCRSVFPRCLGRKQDMLSYSMTTAINHTPHSPGDGYTIPTDM